MLTKHSTVEVSCNDPTFHGAWYTATIIDEIRLSPTKKTNISYLVKYDTLFLKKDDSFHPLVEVVDPSFVRPSPPRNIRRNNANDADVAVVEKKGEGGGGFEVGDVVDAYYKDGWWIGAVKSVIIDDGEIRKYVVLFENNTREEFEFDGCKLRFHVDWVDCRWIIPPKKTPEQLLGDRNATDKALSGFITPSIGAHITETVGSAKKNHRSREKPESNSAADSSRGKRFRPSAGVGSVRDASTDG